MRMVPNSPEEGRAVRDIAPPPVLFRYYTQKRRGMQEEVFPPPGRGVSDLRAPADLHCRLRHGNSAKTGWQETGAVL